MVEHQEVKRPTKTGKNPGRRPMVGRIEPILVGLIFLWLIVVFGVLAYATILSADHALQLLPTVAPTPKS